MKFFTKKQADIPRRRLTTVDSSISSPTSSDIFKRNRTLTGTTSNRLDSLNIVKAGLESPRSHVHHLTNKRRKVFSIFLVVVACIVILWTLVSHFTATVVISTGSALSRSVDSSRYETVVQDYFAVNPLSRFQFFLDQAALSAYVANKLTEVESVINKGMVNIGATSFAITMRVPVAGWKINDKQYFVDTKGVPFDQNYFAAPIVQIIDNSGASLQTGEASVSKRFLGFVGRIVSLAKDSSYTVTQAILPANTTRELEIKLKENNLLVKLSIDRPAGEQVEDMSRAVRYFVSHNQTPAYIDVRVSGRAFYK